MCTAATYKTKDFYMGRTLDYEFSYGEEIVITPRHYTFAYRFMGKQSSHYAIIGMAHVAGGFPLYYDAVNEKGLCMAGLNFVGNACYQQEKQGETNVAQYEFIPWILSQCANVEEAKQMLHQIRLVDTPFHETLPTAELHWMLADAENTITVEYVESGLRIYENKVGVLTNNPPFDMQMFLLNNLGGISRKHTENMFADQLELSRYSRGMGGLGLPGDLSSASRFARVAFTRLNSISGDSEEESVSQFFHILGSVDQQRGCCELEPGKFEITIYTSCMNTNKGIYYYTTYENHQISAVRMWAEDLDSEALIRYPVREKEQICYQNE